MNILTIDIGTTSIRGILFNACGKVLGEKGIHTELIHRGEFIEQSPTVYRNAALEICGELAKKHSVDAISVTGFRSAITLVDRQGNALRDFIMWQDRRNVPLCQQLHAFGGEVWQRSGASLNPVFVATKLLWLKKNQPELYDAAYKYLIVPDYLVLQMTGEFATDRSYGSRTHLMDLETQEWDPRLLEIFDLDKEKLPPLCDPGSIVGYVRPEFADAAGLSAGIPVISAGGDQQCGALGLGVLESGMAEVNCGTGAFAIVLSEQAQHIPGCICNVSAIPGKYVVEANILTGAASLNWLRETAFSEIIGAPDEYAQLNAMADTAPRGAGGVYCLPHFQGCGSRSWDTPAKAAFWGMSLSTTRGELLRALYEGLAAEITKSIQHLPLPQDAAIFVGGGLSKSKTYLQILSDMTGRRICCYADAQATAIGAFASAAVQLKQADSYATALALARGNSGLTELTPNPEAFAFYQEYLAETERIFKIMWQK